MGATFDQLETRGSRGNEGYARFRAAVLGGHLRPGATLTQADLCAALDMSLSPLRDTLTLLEADGLVVVRRRAGITVLTPDVAFIRRNFQFRTMIECDAIETFAEAAEGSWIAATQAQHRAALADLDTTASSGEITGTEARLRAIDWNFHSAIVAALRNPMISETHFHLQQNLQLSRVLNEELASPSKIREALGEHIVILDRLEARDRSGAVVALKAHFRAAIHRAFAT